MNQRSRILAMTVGGSAGPLITAVETTAPDHIFFLCTTGSSGSDQAVDGDGHPFAARQQLCPECGHRFHAGSDKGPSLARQLRLGSEQYTKLLVEADDLDDNWRVLREMESAIEERFPGAEVFLNYTGGTKTMSAAVVLFGLLRPDWTLHLSAGPRKDLVRVRGGEHVNLAAALGVQLELTLRQTVAPLLGIHAYGPAAKLLRALLSTVQHGTGRQKRLSLLTGAAEAFDAWDRFDHELAFSLFERHGLAPLFGKTFKALLALVGRGRTSGYEPVADLVANAERRAAEQRYDDAVARLYRATEMLAQVRLEQEHDLHTGDLDVTRLPPAFLEEVGGAPEGGKLMIGLRHAWDLLALLDQELRPVWEAHRSRILNALSLRNNSILAHGTDPVGKEGWQTARPQFLALLEEGCRAAGSPMRPAPFPGQSLLEVL